MHRTNILMTDVLEQEDSPAFQAVVMIYPEDSDLTGVIIDVKDENTLEKVGSVIVENRKGKLLVHLWDATNDDSGTPSMTVQLHPQFEYAETPPDYDENQPPLMAGEEG